MNTELIDGRISEIKTLLASSGKEVDAGKLGKFFGSIDALKGWDGIRINPVDFSRRFGMNVDESLPLFIYGAKAGIFSFEWNLLCPYCGGREHSHDSLNQLEKETYHCTVCDADVEVEADSHLEVTFTLKNDISGFNPDPHRTRDDYDRYFFNPFLVRPPELTDALARQPVMRFAVLRPGRKARIRLGITPAKKHRIVTLDTHSIFTVYMNDIPADGTQRIGVNHLGTGFDRKEITIDGGPAELDVTNKSQMTIGLLASSPDSAYLETTIKKHPPHFKPFVTGKMMLNNQNFRELFLVDNLPNDLSLKVNDITLMFTDLKGSTEMYQKTGDIRAYRLVQEHFRILQEMVRRNRGAIVKTMGDAIMASFCHPADGVKSASEMLEEIRGFNRTISVTGDAIGLKIGLHRGPVIAVKANQTLDYFGQTVNIAARVQGLAGSGEIWITGDMLRDGGAAEVIGSMGYTLARKEVALKGVGGMMEVHQCCR